MELSELVSVIIPIYNIDDFLRKCIDSVIGQTFKNLDIILVNDGSSDNCGVICDEYAAKDNRIRVIHKPNGGLVSARKSGLEISVGNYIAYVDGDDWITPNAFEILVTEAKKTDADIVIAAHLDDFGERVEYIYNKIPEGVYSGNLLSNDVFPTMLCTGKFSQFGINSYVWNKLFKREILAKTQPIVPNDISIGEDAAVTYPALLLSEKISVLEIPLYHYRQHPSSMVKTLKNIENERMGILRLYSYLGNIFKTYPKNYNLKQQLEAYILSLAIVRHGAFDIRSKQLFPFDKVREGSEIVLIGAGTFGKHLYNRLQKTQSIKIVKWVDPYSLSDSKGVSLCDIAALDFDYVVIAYIDETIIGHWMYELNTVGVPPKKIASVDFKLNSSGAILESLGFKEDI